MDGRAIRWMVVLLAPFLLPAVVANAAEENLYFDRIIQEFVRIEEDAGEILSFETVASLTENKALPLGDRQRAEVRRLGQGMSLVVQDMEGHGRLARDFGISDWNGDPTLVRVLRKSRSSSAYDAPFVPSFRNFLSGEEIESSIATEGKLPKGMAILDMLVRVPSEAAIRVAILAMEDPGAALVAIEQCRAGGLENDLFLAAIELEAAAMADDGVRVEELLSKWDSRLRSSGSAVYVVMPGFLERWLRGHKADTSGENRLLSWRRLDVAASAGDWALMREMLRGVSAEGLLFRQDATVLLHRLLTKPPHEVYFGYLMRQVWALVITDMIRGDFHAAMEAARGFSLASSTMSHDNANLAGSLHGAGLLAGAAKMWQWLLLDSSLPLDSLKAVRAELAAVVRIDEEGVRNPSAVHHAPPGIVYEGRPIMLEYHTRRRISHTQLALLHAVAVARLHLEEKGSFPESPWRFYDLLGDLSGDPFADWKEPLLYRPMADRIVVYSRGPNKKDDGGTVPYSPINGTLSAGDLIEEVLLHPPKGFPLPLGDQFSPRDIQRHLPDGIHCYSNGSWNMGHVNSVPASVFCDGPAGASFLRGSKLVGSLPAGHAAIEKDGEWYNLGPAASLAVYDPTNGVHSEGVLFLVRDGQPVR